jgi:hypothetical protein
LSLRPSKQKATTTPAREEPTKSLHPQGTLPMKESGKNEENNNNEDGTSKANISLNLDSLVKSDPKESSSNKEGTDANSIANNIATLRAQLFKGDTQDTASEGHEDGCDSMEKKRAQKVKGSQSHGCLLQKEEVPKPKYPSKGRYLQKEPISSKKQGNHSRRLQGRPTHPLCLQV